MPPDVIMDVADALHLNIVEKETSVKQTHRCLMLLASTMYNAYHHSYMWGQCLGLHDEEDDLDEA